MPNNSAQFLVDLTVLHTTEQLRGGARDFCAVLDRGVSYFSRSDIHLNSIAAGPSTHNREAEDFKDKDPAT
jgi:hypothetical protein